MREYFLGLLDLAPDVLVFVVIVLAAERIGQFGSRWRLPLITGYLAAGFLAGPDVLKILDRSAVDDLGFVNQIALAIIALAAGNELVLKEFRSQFRSIGWVTFGLVVMTFGLGAATMYILSGWLPVMKDLGTSTRIAISLLAGVILVARSPSSAIAIVNELRAKGPLTNTILGVTVIMDAVVIALFAVNSEIAHSITSSDFHFGFGFLGLLLVKFALSIGAGCALWKLLCGYLRWPVPHYLKFVLLLVTGFGVFQLTDWFHHFSEDTWGLKIHAEPLLICMIAGLLVTNFSPHRAEFSKLLKEIGSPVYLTFFTLTGASIDLAVLQQTYLVAAGLCMVRLLTVFAGSFLGSTIAGDAPRYRRIIWLGFVTQAGIGIGLAREISVHFDDWGSKLATILIAVIVINQIIGPPMFKWAVGLAGEIRRKSAGFHEGPQSAFIFGSPAGAPMMLANQLVSRGCNVTLVTLDESARIEEAQSGARVITIPEISLESLQTLPLNDADVLIGLMGDDDNLALCELNDREFAIEKIVVRFTERIEEGRRWHDRGVIVLDPKTSLVSVLEHFVTSPAATSILLGMDPEQDVIEVEVTDPTLVGVPIHDLKLPLDALILAITRNGHTLISHGYTELQLGDQLTVVGPPEVLPEATVYFEK
ncbi:MAG TPA: potassium transporter TrkA [Planctomycetaceae bacterium]|nr:potassium transporter TrkA [Planctomycetaceae bacterium]HCD02719.1 potassium transporter TrkA [Planctomycetaceae bacterium]